MMNKKKNNDWTGNQNSIYKTIGSSHHCEEEREENDYYATNPAAIDKLLEVENPSRYIWECAAGENHLANRLKEKGYEVFSTDIIERNVKLDEILDFLKVEKRNYDNFDILTNPPYKYAKEFVLKAMDLIPEGNKVYMFLKLTFLEGKARRKEIFDKFPPKNIYVLSERLMCAKNGKFSKYNNKGNAHGAVAYAWYVWEKGYQGDTVLRWI